MKLAYQDSFLSPIKFHLFPVNDYFTELCNSASQPFTANIKTSADITIALDRHINQVFHFQDVRVALKNFSTLLEKIELTLTSEQLFPEHVDLEMKFSSPTSVETSSGWQRSTFLRKAFPVFSIRFVT